jgi:transcriptional regulator with XRE-family HTH domain
MLDIGTKITLLRKEKGLSQTELSEKISCSRATLINYEGNKNTPSIETAVKLSQIFDVTLDYLAGKGKFTDYSNDTIKRIEGIQNLDSSTQKQIFNIIDTYLRDSRARIAYAG